MSSFDKLVKLACKPKAAPPKAKYLDPIVAATWSEDGAVHDVCKALVPRLREPNAVVVFKALIVLHTMIRNGATDNVLSHLSSSEVLRLRNVSAGNWEGYNAPQNIQLYALYLDSRIRAFRELKHDAIRVQAETNRDLRLHNSIEEDMAYTTAPPSKASSTKSRAPQRSKTMMGRKLRVMTVEKGLLRETKTVQTMIDSLVECRFYLDNLEDELTITALRMLVKDLLILFQASNEGVINVLEHYFEMSKYDAKEALTIYRNFCDQTERVVEYLGVARKLQNLLNVPIPDLRHASLSLANSLQEYLDDPNFEQNRIEYKASKENPDGNRDHSGTTSAQSPRGTSMVSVNSVTNEKSVKPTSPTTVANSKPNPGHAISDLFGSIEEETAVVNAAASSPMGYPQQPTAHNPFVQRQMSGAFTSQSFGGQVQIQPTGFPAPLPFHFVQPTQKLPLSHANSLGIQSQPTPQHRPFSTFIPQQAISLPTGPTTGFLQPQPTGANPFRQSILIPHATGVPPSNSNGIPPMPPPAWQRMGPTPQVTSNPQPVPLNTQFGHNNPLPEVPVRPASTPLTSIASGPSSISPPMAQPVKSHQTGSRNPFGIPVTPAPPVPKPPTLLELSKGFGRLGIDGNKTQPQLHSTGTSPQVHGIATGATESTFSTVASSFVSTIKLEGSTISPTSDLNHLESHQLNLQTVSTSATSPNFSGSLLASVPSQPNDSAITLHVPSIPVAAPIKSQSTGFGGVKPFKPTSTFGASLLDSLPPIPQSGTTTPDASTRATTSSSPPSLPTTITFGGFAASAPGQDINVPGSIVVQPTSMALPSRGVNGGFAPGVGLRPQATGSLGAANPFRTTMLATTSALSTGGVILHPFIPPASTPMFGGLGNGTGGLPASGPGNTVFSSNFTHLGHNSSNVQQENAGTSLI